MCITRVPLYTDEGHRTVLDEVKALFLRDATYSPQGDAQEGYGRNVGGTTYSPQGAPQGNRQGNIIAL